jgi:opacity protein-like surface antigen
MTKQFVKGFMVTVALCLGATVGRAQTSLVYVTGGGTAIRDAQAFELKLIPFTSQFASGGGGNLGVEVPLKKSKIFGLELSYGLSQNNFELTNQNTNPTTTVSYGLRDNRISGDIVLHSPSTFRNIRPYLVAGPEYDRYSPTSAAVSLAARVGFGASAPVAKLGSEGDWGVNIGGGLDYKVTEKWGVRIDVRDHLTDSPTLGLPYAPTSTSPAYFPVSGKASSITYTIGLVYHFGGGKASSAETKSSQPGSSGQASPAKEKSSAKEKSPAKEKPSPSSVFN